MIWKFCFDCGRKDPGILQQYEDLKRKGSTALQIIPVLYRYFRMGMIITENPGRSGDLWEKYGIHYKTADEIRGLMAGRSDIYPFFRYWMKELQDLEIDGKTGIVDAEQGLKVLLIRILPMREDNHEKL